jgi:Dockerin type I domain
MSRPYFLRVLSLSIVLGTTGLACAALIDDFSAGPFSLEAIRFEIKSIDQRNLPADHVIGGSRFVTFTGRNPPVRVGVAVGNGHFHYDADSGASATNFEIAYGKHSNLHADLLADGSNSLVYEFDSVNLEPERLYLYAPVYNSSGPTSLILPYWAFNREPYDANFSDIAGISIGTGNGNLYGDFVLTSIRTAFYPRGDYSFDGRVDQADFQVWRNSFGREGPYWGGYPVDAADGNRDGVVDASDYVLWRKNFSLSADAMSGPSTVPEVSAFLLVIEAVIGAMFSGFVRTRRFSIMTAHG